MPPAQTLETAAMPAQTEANASFWMPPILRRPPIDGEN